MEDLNNTIYMTQSMLKKSRFSDYNVLQFEIGEQKKNSSKTKQNTLLNSLYVKTETLREMRTYLAPEDNDNAT